ncbi:MAG: prolipoprotein diacylglyceryl transferase [Candidatus Spyradosoma sp.]
MIPVTTATPTPGYWVHDLDPFLMRFPEGWFLEGVRWYGLAYLAGFVFGAVMLSVYYRKNRSPLDPDAQSSFMVALIVGVLVGARLGYMLFYAWDALVADPLSAFRVWNGGMSSHGGMIGATLATWIFSRRRKCSFLQLGDIIASLAPAGVFFGRIANFINGELYGRETSVPWAVIFRYEKFNPFTGTPETFFLLPRHPSQLYAAAGEGLLILLWTQLRFWKKKPLPHGRIIGEACLLYAAVRIADEFFREPDVGVGFILGLTLGQFYSVVLALVGVVFVVAARRRKIES